MRLVSCRFDGGEGGCVVGGCGAGLRGAAGYVGSPGQFVVGALGGEKTAALAGLEQGVGDGRPCDAHRGALGQ